MTVDRQIPAEPISRAAIFAILGRARGVPWDAPSIALFDDVLDRLEIGRDGALTARGLAEIVSHESIVQEAYKDIKGVWTWGVGVTSASGHAVERYRDNPQPIGRCLEVFAWLLRERYLPEVQKAFQGQPLSEAQLTAALSFHYNTGKIGKASWVKTWLDGGRDVARAQFMDWRIPAAVIPRRQKECDLFFDGRWSGTGTATVYPVSKPSYAPKMSAGKRIDISADLRLLIAAA